MERTGLTEIFLKKFHAFGDLHPYNISELHEKLGLSFLLIIGMTERHRLVILPWWTTQWFFLAQTNTQMSANGLT